MVCSCQRVFKNIRHDLLFFLTFIYFREGQYFKTRLFFLNFFLGGPFSASNSKKITHAEILGDPYRTEFFVWLVYLFHFYLIFFPLIRGQGFKHLIKFFTIYISPSLIQIVIKIVRWTIFFFCQPRMISVRGLHDSSK